MEALSRIPRRPRSKGISSTLIKEVNPFQRPRDSRRSGIYMEALIMPPIKELFNTEQPFNSRLFSATSQQFWELTVSANPGKLRRQLFVSHGTKWNMGN
jgi:hypothetical protein